MADSKSRVTDEATSSPEQIRKAADETRKVKVGGLVFAIRRIPTPRIDDILDRSEAVAKDSVKAQLAYQREIGQLAMEGLGQVWFDRNDADQAGWDELPVPIQRDLIQEILAFTMAGTEEVARALKTFPGGEERSGVHETPNGATGEGRAAAGNDRGEAAASMAGDAAER